MSRSSSTLSDEILVTQKDKDKDKENEIKNASFTVEDVLSYGVEYNKCLRKCNDKNNFKEKYLNIFNKRTGNSSENFSPYGKKRISWMTLYEKVIRKIIAPFRYSDNINKEYVTLEEIENRISIVIYKDRTKNPELKQKENDHLIPKIMKMFNFEVKKKKRSEEEKKKQKGVIQLSSTLVPKSLSSKRRMSTTFRKSGPAFQSLLSPPVTTNPQQPQDPQPSSIRPSKTGGKATIKLSNINLDNLQRAYDNHNNINNYPLSNGNTNSSNYSKQGVRRSQPIKFKSDNLNSTNQNKISTGNEVDSHDIRRLKTQQRRRSTAISGFEERFFLPLSKLNYSPSRSPSRSPTRSPRSRSPRSPRRKSPSLTMRQYSDTYRQFRMIPSADYRNFSTISSYKKMEKLAYKDEISFFMNNERQIGTECKSDYDKHLNNILHLINFGDEHSLQNMDNENELGARGDRIASYKKMGDDIYNYLILNYKEK